MSANGEFSERVRVAVAAGDVAEVEKLLSSDWAASWTQKRAKDVLDEIRDGGTLSPTSALNYALIVAISAANQLHVAQAQCNALRLRIEELEESATAYKGIWREENTPYGRGALTTHKGVLWYAWKVTSARPGASSDWQLMVKHARD
ncbi:MAG TPA: hypothetical protein VFO82_05740 [Steroidobacteraceae bacterium]|nr:hypothetical protein [Steroidobacteraceae bacterium]